MKTGVIDSAVCLPVVKGKLTLDPWLREAGPWKIAHAIVAPSGGFVAVDNLEANRQMVRLVKAGRGKISGLAVANPWYGKRAVEMLRLAFKQGLVGLYLHPPCQGFRLTESIVDPLLEVCRRRRKPVYAHTGTPICSEPFQLAELARRFPEVTFIMGHAAYPDFWYDVTAALQQSPNLLVETSCQMSAVLQQALDAIGPDRVLFGSGWPRSRPGIEILKIQSMGLPAETLEKIMQTNAMRCWGLTP